MDVDERKFIDDLSKRDISDADLISSIEVLEVLLSVEALPALVRFVSDKSHSDILRERAARAINTMGSKYVMNDILEWEQSNELCVFAKIALGK
jgi:HEAT repeat protein